MKGKDAKNMLEGKKRHSSVSASAAAAKEGEKKKRGRPSKSPGTKKDRASKGIKKGHRK